MEQWFFWERFAASAPVRAATLANVSKIYLVFQLLDLGLGDCVFDLELLGAEMEEKEKGGEERRGWSDHQTHGCTSSPSTVDTEGGCRQRTSQPQRPGTARSEINILSGGRSQLSPLKCEKCKMFKRIDGKLEEPSSQGNLATADNDAAGMEME